MLSLAKSTKIIYPETSNISEPESATENANCTLYSPFGYTRNVERWFEEWGKLETLLRKVPKSKSAKPVVKKPKPGQGVNARPSCKICVLAQWSVKMT